MDTKVIRIIIKMESRKKNKTKSLYYTNKENFNIYRCKMSETESIKLEIRSVDRREKDGRRTNKEVMCSVCYNK